ncbi:hypothetical protein DPEC_G00073810 [Dallia pectoralis]|uniref:Uncharacterized protein n=1 Tax=Dallia pectoralis TaxID=75939 RepID=A0ACC2H2R5_DALPE|nr:hypothetical protein DPEC_G00073810 [Dallia pectoralis]
MCDGWQWVWTRRRLQPSCASIAEEPQERSGGATRAQERTGHSVRGADSNPERRCGCLCALTGVLRDISTGCVPLRGAERRSRTSLYRGSPDRTGPICVTHNKILTQEITGH